AGLRDRPVELQSLVVLRQVAHLQELVRELVERVDAALGRGAGVRGLALDRQVRRADAARRQANAAIAAAAFEREHGVLVGGDARDRAARAGRADLLVAVADHLRRAG